MSKSKKLSFNRRIDAFLSTPLFISESWGFTQLMTYLNELEFAADGQTEILKETWRQRKESNQTQYLSFSDGNYKRVDEEIGLQNKNSIAIVQLRGAMQSDDGLSSLGIDHTCNQLELAASSNARGIILNTSSGGGAVEAAQRLYSTMKDISGSKPIVQLINTTSASGAVFAGVASDKIIANGATAETGSIGVVMQLPKWWIQEMKDEVISIYADQSPDKHSLMKNLIAENYDAIKNEELNPFAIEFQNLVKRERKGVDVSALTGKMYIAKDAMKMGLIDGIGTMKTALNEVRKLSTQRNKNSNARRAAESINFTI